MLRNLPSITLLEMERTKIGTQVPLTPKPDHNCGVLSIFPTLSVL